jgi:hypothetical protein
MLRVPYTRTRSTKIELQSCRTLNEVNESTMNGLRLYTDLLLSQIGKLYGLCRYFVVKISC